MQLTRITAQVGQIEREGHMLVPARFYLPTDDLEALRQERALQQLVGVAHLPGIVPYALAMPDMHWGYGFPIGGVAAVDASEGAISPGGVGYDINCGVRVITTELAADAVRARREDLVKALYKHIPVGVGAARAIPRLDPSEVKKVMRRGARWAIEQGYAAGADDAEHCEEGGCLADADPEAVSERAIERGSTQLGTLGSGNHFLEVDAVETIFEPSVAAAFGLQQGATAVMIHSGSRGLGHQTCDDTLSVLTRQMGTYGELYARVPDRQLACAPIRSAAGRKYLGAMQAAANFAWANRQVMTGLTVQAFREALGVSTPELGARLLYDVCHNIAKVETHMVQGTARHVLVHRKGATRAFGPGDERIPRAYYHVGQPTLIPGDMGRCSYVLVGTEKAMQDTFGSACHGAGRVLSRHQARKRARGRHIDEELRARGIEVMARARRTLGEEMSEAYKDVNEVVATLEAEGIVKTVARLRPIGVIKG